MLLAGWPRNLSPGDAKIALLHAFALVLKLRAYLRAQLKALVGVDKCVEKLVANDLLDHRSQLGRRQICNRGRHDLLPRKRDSARARKAFASQSVHEEMNIR